MGGRKEHMVDRRVYSGDINTSDGWINILSSVNLGNLLGGDMFRISTEERGKEIRRKIHDAKHFIAHRETIQGRKDSSTAMRRKTRVGRRWRNVKFPFSDNSFSRNAISRNANRFFERGKVELGLPNVLTQRQKICFDAIKIFPKRLFSAEGKDGRVYRFREYRQARQQGVGNTTSISM